MRGRSHPLGPRGFSRDIVPPPLRACASPRGRRPRHRGHGPLDLKLYDADLELADTANSAPSQASMPDQTEVIPLLSRRPPVEARGLKRAAAAGLGVVAVLALSVAARRARRARRRRAVRAAGCAGRAADRAVVAAVQAHVHVDRRVQGRRVARRDARAAHRRGAGDEDARRRRRRGRDDVRAPAAALVDGRLPVPLLPVVRHARGAARRGRRLHRQLDGRARRPRRRRLRVGCARAPVRHAVRAVDHAVRPPAQRARRADAALAVRARAEGHAEAVDVLAARDGPARGPHARAHERRGARGLAPPCSTTSRRSPSASARTARPRRCSSRRRCSRRRGGRALPPAGRHVLWPRRRRRPARPHHRRGLGADDGRRRRAAPLPREHHRRHREDDAAQRDQRLVRNERCADVDRRLRHRAPRVAAHRQRRRRARARRARRARARRARGARGYVGFGRGWDRWMDVRAIARARVPVARKS